MLPREFAHWKTVYHYFRLWRLTGLWDRIHVQHIVVDVLGLILAVAVTGANVQDRDGGPVRARRAEGPLSPDSAGVGGWSIRRSTCGMGAEDGQVCARYRWQTKGTDRLFRSAMALDRGAHLRL